MVKRNANLRRSVRRLECLRDVVPFIFCMTFPCNVCLSGQNLSQSELIKKSRESCVRVLVQLESRWLPAGTGFFIDPNRVVTCWHVIAGDPPIDPNTKGIDYSKWRPYSDIAVITAAGDQISAECTDTPTATEPGPVRCDFAILKLKTKPTQGISCVPLSQGTINPTEGDDVYFSGFPLGAPAMLTHKGMLSGFTKGQTRLCIQAPVNKGNSGGALLNTQGEVIGIISYKEGGITKDLGRVRKAITALKEQNVLSVTTEGEKIDLLTVEKDIIDVLDTYISTGIGYARNISCARDYVKKYSLMKSGSGSK